MKESIIAAVIANFSAFALLMIYIGFTVLCCIIESNFIRMRSRGEKILPAAVLAVGVITLLILYGQGAFTNTITRGMSHEVLADSGSAKPACINILMDGDNDIVAVGKLAVGQGSDVVFRDISVVNGKVTAGAGEYKSHLNDIMSGRHNSSYFTGTSVSYGKLLALKKDMKVKTVTVAGSQIILIVLAAILPFLIVLYIFIASGHKRKKKNLLLKTKLEDM
ncbi:MAG: hypothetical protein LKJ83_05365 [Eubacteriaceae bacterium]|jgi:hypothetical protein|nr:hypothetical protein [Eubacteriaceae bacterium]